MLQEISSTTAIIFIGGTAIVLILAVFIIVYIFLHHSKIDKFKLDIKEKEIQKQNDLIAAINSTEEKERGRISDELHDSIGAKLTVIKFSLEYLRFQSNLSAEDTLLVKNLNRYLDDTITEIREITHNLAPSSLIEHGLRDALENLIFQFNKFGSCEYSIYIDEEVNSYTNHIPMIYRVGSELLQNIHKHSKASTASLQILLEDGICKIISEDNGFGFDKEKNNKAISKGIGLENIKNKVNAFDGILNIDSSINGTTIIIELNFNPKKEQIEMSEIITVYIADDHQIIVDGLFLLLKNENKIRVIGTGNDGEKAELDILELKPDIAIIDIKMPIKDGIQLLKSLNGKSKTKCIILSMHDERRLIEDSISNNAKAYLLKNTGKSELMKVINLVHQGSTSFPKTEERTSNDPNKFLTPREMDILKLVLNDYSSNEIAEKLKLSPFTVDTHRKNLMRKTKSKTLAGLLKYVKENNLDYNL